MKPTIEILENISRNSSKNKDEIFTRLFGTFAPNSKTAEEMSRNLGKQTVLSGTVT